jgi:hypothetical protein
MPGGYQLAVLLTVAVGSFTVGFSVASAANVIGLPRFLEYFDISLTSANPSYAASMQGGESLGHLQTHAEPIQLSLGDGTLEALSARYVRDGSRIALAVDGPFKRLQSWH